MKLTQRDERLLCDLHTYGFLTTGIINARFFPNVAKTTVLRRLRLLEDAGYIHRITGLEDGCCAWGLTRSSAQRFLPSPSKIHFARFQLDHDLRLLRLRLKLEEAGIAHSWRPEHVIRSRVSSAHGIRRAKEKLIPDGLMGIERNGIKETMAIELELFAKNQSRYRDIFREYASKKSLWAAWYLVRHPVIGRQVRRAANDSVRFENSPHVLWSTFDDVIKDPLNAPIHGHSKTYKVIDLVDPKPAHTSDHPVSRQENQKPREENRLSSVIETKTPAPCEIEGVPPPPLATLPQH